ncbi:hypothetical protein E4U30_000737, partial [Claviceps sp. LM220 group G6]
MHRFCTNIGGERSSGRIPEKVMLYPADTRALSAADQLTNLPHDILMLPVGVASQWVLPVESVQFQWSLVPGGTVA